jgi:hypothetical protein
MSQAASGLQCGRGKLLLIMRFHSKCGRWVSTPRRPVAGNPRPGHIQLQG